MSVVTRGPVRLYSSILLGSLLWLEGPVGVHARGRAGALRAQAPQSPLMVVCSPNPCAVESRTSGAHADGWIGGYAVTPNAIGASGTAMFGTASFSSPSDRGAAAAGAVAPSEMITVTGAVISATDVTTASLATPALPAAIATTAGSIGSTAQNGAVTFTGVPVLLNSSYAVLVATQSTRLDSAVRFHFMRPKARPR